MMKPAIRLAVSQFPVSGDLHANAVFIEKHVKEAALRNAHVVHFPEAALSGYASVDFVSFDRFDWQVLGTLTDRICGLAAAHGVWVVLGSTRRLAPDKRPLNCLHVISPAGAIIGSYDKRSLYGSELEIFDTGTKPLVITVNETKCGFLICFDSCFPELYESYRNRGVQLLFHSYYNAKNTGTSTTLDELMSAQLRTRAADNRFWISASNSSARHSRLASCVARPDGSLHSTKRHVPGLLIHDFPDSDLGWTYDNRRTSTDSDPIVA